MNKLILCVSLNKHRFFLFGLLSLYSCEEFVRVAPPKTQIVSASVYSDDATAVSAVAAIYSVMMESDGFASGYQTSIALLGGLSADEFKNYTATREDFYRNSLVPDKPEIFSLWQQMYSAIYYANSILEGLNNSTSLSADTKRQLSGEARFVRAFCFFYLVNLFGDVPLVTSTDYRINAVSERTATTKIYNQIVDDLVQAKQELAADYSFAKDERIRPTVWAATALLARVYLFQTEWSNAEQESTSLIDNSLFALEDDLNHVFLKESRESIWQLMPVVPGYNTWEGKVFKIQDFVSLSDQIVNAFENGDLRRSAWMTILNENELQFAANKYKIYEDGQPLSEYSIVFRLGEQYLIRAEARANQNKISDGEADINILRNRAGLEDISGSDQASLLAIIEHERQVELFSEWGHRWFDLKRTGKTDEILGPIKGSTWQSTDTLYPLPQSEMESDPNLVPQNPGY